MKRKDRHKECVLACLVALILMFLFLWATPKVIGGTHSQKVPLMYGVVDPDSVMVRMFEIGSGSQIGGDSIISSFPDTVVYGSLDSAKAYEIQIFERWYGSGEYERPITWTIPLLSMTSAGIDSILNAIADANKGNFKADVSALAHQTTVDSIYDTAVICRNYVLLNYAEIMNLDGWNPITDNESLIVDQSSLEDLSLASRAKIGDTSSGVDEVLAEIVNIDGWTPTTDSVLTKNPNAYKADVSGLSTFDPTNDSVDITEQAAKHIADSVLNDSLAYQGASSSLTATKISDTIRAGIISDHGSGSYTAAGTGANALKVYSIDTSGTDDTVSNVSITLQNATGSQLAVQITGDSGFADFYVASGVIRGLAMLGASYRFPDTEWTISANDTVAILGYNTYIASPSNPNNSRVYAYIYKIDSTYANDIIVSATRHKGNATDLNAGVIISSQTVYDTTADSGFFYFDLLRTGQYTDTTMGFYDIKGVYRNLVVFSIDSLYIPDTGNVNLTDSIALR